MNKIHPQKNRGKVLKRWWAWFLLCSWEDVARRWERESGCGEGETHFQPTTAQEIKRGKYSPRHAALSKLSEVPLVLKRSTKFRL